MKSGVNLEQFRQGSGEMCPREFCIIGVHRWNLWQGYDPITVVTSVVEWRVSADSRAKMPA